MRTGRAVTVLGGLAGMAVAALAADAAVLTPRRLAVRELHLALPGWPAGLDGLRVAVVSDVHAGAPFVGLDRVRDVVDRVLATEPDVVLLLGDLLADVVGGTHLEPEAVADALAGLTAVPVAAVLGNHDWYAGGHRVRRALEAVGVPVLEEQALPVLDGRLWLAGVGDLWERSPSVERALADVPAGAPTVLLTHNPDVVVDVPAHVPLVVAGHTHGGQLAVRGRPFHRVSQRSRNRWSAGWYPADRLYVTAGVGSSTVPLRSVRPEVGLLVLGPA